MACGVVPLQIEQRRHLRWLHRLAVVAVTQANFAVYVYTKCDEYFNVTGLLSNTLAVLMAVLCVHLVILEVLAYVSGTMDSHYLDPSERDRSLSDPETSLSSGIRQQEVKALATPAVNQERNYPFPSSCYQLLQLSSSVNPTVTDLNIAATRPSMLLTPPYDVTRRYSTSSLSDPDADQIPAESREEKRLPVTSSSATDVTSKPGYDKDPGTTDNKIIITSDNRKEMEQEAPCLFTSRTDRTIRRPRGQSCVTRTIELLCCVYVVVDVVKAVCCIAVLRRLLLYLFLYYWRLSAMNIITVFLSSTVVIVFEVSLTVAGFILQYEQMNSDLCLSQKS